MKKSLSIIGGCGFLGSYDTQKILAEDDTAKESTSDKSQQESYQHMLHMHPDESVDVVEMGVLDAATVAQFGVLRQAFPV